MLSIRREGEAAISDVLLEGGLVVGTSLMDDPLIKKLGSVEICSFFSYLIFQKIIQTSPTFRRYKTITDS